MVENPSQEFGSDAIINGFYYEDFFGQSAKTDSEGSKDHDQDAADVKHDDDVPPLDILQWQPQSIFPAYEDSIWATTSSVGNILCGSWTGHFLRTTPKGGHVTTQGPLQMLLRQGDQPQVYCGEALSHSGFLDVDFKAEGTTTLTSIGMEITLTYRSDDDIYTITAVGTLDLTRDVMSGTWDVEVDSPLTKLEHEGYYSGESMDASADEESSGEEPEAEATSSNPTTSQVFFFTRTPASLMKYRYSPQEVHKNPSRARWRFACNAVLHQVRETKLSWARIRDRGNKRRRFVNLTSKALLHFREPLPGSDGPSQSELDEIKNILTDLSPLDARFYVQLAEDELLKHTLYGYASP